METDIDRIIRELTVFTAQIIFAKQSTEPVDQFQFQVARRLLDHSGILDELQK